MFSFRAFFMLGIAVAMSSLMLGQVANVEKVVFIGDSITQHGPSVEKLGWHGNYGMAASAQDKDYVHVFMRKLEEAQGHPVEALIYAKGGGTLPGQLRFLDDFRDAQAQIAVIQMGENDKIKDDGAAFRVDYAKILAAIRKGNPKCQIYCFSVWSHPIGSPLKDKIIWELCEQYGATLVSLRAVNANPANQAAKENRFTHPGVNWHPGDRGMQAMADALWAAYQGKDPEEIALAGPSDWKFREAWTKPLAGKWSPTPPVEDGVMVMKQATADGAVTYTMDLPSDKIRGHTLAIQMQVKAIDISAKPKPWNGVKIMLRLQNAEGEVTYPQYRLPDGSYDWREVIWTPSIPDNIVKAQFVLGLERVSGTAMIKPLKMAAKAL